MTIIRMKKIRLIIAGILFISAFGLYMRYFNHGPPEEILAANRKTRGFQSIKKDNIDDDDMAEAEYQWQSFLEAHSYVTIGGVYDSCEEEVRKTIGTSIILPDGKGGMKSRTFINMTLDIDVTDGLFCMEVKYNGQELFSTEWDLCTLDEHFDDRLIFCPVKAGKLAWVKDKMIPGYLPKGRYETKAWVTDQTEEIIACGYSDFIL